MVLGLLFVPSSKRMLKEWKGSVELDSYPGTWCSTSRNIVLGEKLRKPSSRSISGREIRGDRWIFSRQYFFFILSIAWKEKVAGVAAGHLSIYTRLSRSFRILRFALRETDTCLMHEFHSCRQFTSSLEPRVPNSTSRSTKLNSPVRGNVRRVRKVQFLPS